MRRGGGGAVQGRRACISLPQDVSTVEGCQALAAASPRARASSTSWSTTPAPPGARTFDEFPENGWDKVMNLNLKSPFFLTQALHGALRAGG